MTRPYVDAHVHVWDPDRLTYPWLADLPALNRAFMPDDYRRVATGGVSSVFIQADAHPEQTLAEVELVEQADWDRLAGIVAYAPIEEPAGLESTLSALADYPRVVGIRRNLQDAPDEFLASPDLLAGLAVVADRGLTFDACIRDRQLPLLSRIVERLPTLKVVLDHLGKPPVRSGFDSERGRLWRESLRRFASAGNAFVKLSGLAPEADARLPLAAQAESFLLHGLECFGPDRTMVGSDWPVSATMGAAQTPDDWADLVTSTLRLDDAATERVSVGTAVEFYGLS
jgi:L-fuconolactonase